MRILDPTQLWRAFCYSCQGIITAIRRERSIQQELVVLVLSVPASFWLGETPVERLLLIGAVLFVILVELLNSALESVADRFGTERNELVGRAKDYGSAAVMIAIVLTVMIWLGVLLN